MRSSVSPSAAVSYRKPGKFIITVVTADLTVTLATPHDDAHVTKLAGMASSARSEGVSAGAAGQQLPTAARAQGRESGGSSIRGRMAKKPIQYVVVSTSMQF
jgi:hypothetical protein